MKMTSCCLMWAKILLLPKKRKEIRTCKIVFSIGYLCCLICCMITNTNLIPYFMSFSYEYEIHLCCGGLFCTSSKAEVDFEPMPQQDSTIMHVPVPILLKCFIIQET